MHKIIKREPDATLSVGLSGSLGLYTIKIYVSQPHLLFYSLTQDVEYQTKAKLS